MSWLNVLNAIDDGRLKRFINTLQQCSQPYIHTRNKRNLPQSVVQKCLRLTAKKITILWLKVKYTLRPHWPTMSQLILVASVRTAEYCYMSSPCIDTTSWDQSHYLCVKFQGLSLFRRYSYRYILWQMTMPVRFCMTHIRSWRQQTQLSYTCIWFFSGLDDNVWNLPESAACRVVSWQRWH